MSASPWTTAARSATLRAVPPRARISAQFCGGLAARRRFRGHHVSAVQPVRPSQKPKDTTQNNRRLVSTVAATKADGAGARGSVQLYGSPGSRSPLVNWYLHELGVDFEARAPSDPTNPHPFGQIPALRDATDDPENPVELFESGAILMYLADRYGGLQTPAQRADAGKWVVWANASLDPCLFIENERGGVIDSGARSKKNPRALDRLEAVLATREWLAAGGAEFGVADVVRAKGSRLDVAACRVTYAHHVVVVTVYAFSDHFCTPDV